MTKPKNMTPEQEAAWLEKARAQARGYYLKEKTQVLEKQAKYRAANRGEIRRKGRIFSKSFYAKNRKVCLERQLKYQRENSEKLNARRTGALPDHYVALVLHLLVATLRQHPELLEAKREHLKALRQLKAQTKTENAPESK